MRRLLYFFSLCLFLTGLALTTTSLALPQWLSHASPSTASLSYGLHSRCTTSSSGIRVCEPFPVPAECRGANRAFCSLWRSLGFAMNLAFVLGLTALVGYAVVLLGGRGRREGGWKVISGLSAAVAGCEIVALALVAFVNDHEARFAVGWGLDISAVLCTASWIVMLCNAVGLVAAAYMLPPEDDYEQIP